MRRGFRIIDTVRHVVEPHDLWDRWLEEPYANPGTLQVDLESPSLAMSVQGRPVVLDRPNWLVAPRYREIFGHAAAEGFSAASNLADMDREGIDVAVLLPTLGLFAIWADHIDPQLAVALSRSYNNWLADYCAADSRRLKGLALLPVQDPREAAKELRRAVADLGFVGALLRPNPLAGRKLHDQACDSIYAEAEALRVPILLTELSGTVLPQIGVDRFDGPFGREAVVDPFEMMLALMSFMGNDVLERFPQLTVGFLGAGVGWLPYWIERVDSHWGNPFFGADSPSVMPPSHLFRTQGFAAADPWERTLPEVLDACGLHSIVWGSQYPYPEIAPHFPDEVDRLLDEALLSDDQKVAILWDNAARIFGIE